MLDCRYKILAAITVAIMLAGCSTSRNTAETDKALPQTTPFWSSLFQNVISAEKEENVCLSPLSALTALAMTADGAEGKTLEQMNTILISDNKSKDFFKSLNEEEDGCEVKLANSIWINDKLDVRQDFIDGNREKFNALVNTIPFDKATAGKINAWCKENTNGKIESIVDKVEPYNMLFLINALYFKAPWRNPFRSANTTRKAFTTEKGNVVNVEMMSQTLKTSYYIDDTVQIVTKPFKSRYDMLLVLPRYGKSIDDALTHLTVRYDSCISDMERYNVELSMPKFKCEYKIILNDALCEMGMRRPFGNEAEFGRISNAPLHIDNVVQKTYINVDEEGAEAAAATAVSVGLMAMPERVKKATMTIDSPFLYAIRDNVTNTILFIGKVGNPNK